VKDSVVPYKWMDMDCIPHWAHGVLEEVRMSLSVDVGVGDDEVVGVAGEQVEGPTRFLIVKDERWGSWERAERAGRAEREDDGFDLDFFDDVSGITLSLAEVK
jgi:hypothetical protein